MQITKQGKYLRILSPAKVNLFLDVISKRPDGYHELESIFQTVNLYDVIRMTGTKSGIRLRTNHPELSVNKDNIVYKAAMLIKNEYRIKQGVEVFIDKNIPIGGGLGGGSSNAASTLIGLNRLWELGLSQSELALQAAKLGSDVPFFIYGGTALVKGRGEIVFPLNLKPRLHYLLVVPSFPVPTKKVYQNLKLGLTKPNPDIRILIKALRNNNYTALTRLLYNRLETTVLQLYPDLRRIYEQLIEHLYDGLLVSGSGSTIFRLCRSEKEVKGLTERLSQDNIVTGRGMGISKVLEVTTV
ncbi:MAG: 4-(cytidine 5'-diphospho)-2-C-methyl-D-erythritol kinase [Planctomycetes bacterium]|nr:4-(cytidine 5'-diphospho)-2-C-methyl-D-erythritol kinase [Planctomycetota bacterium]